MKTITLECLRGLEAPARVAIRRQNGRCQAYLQTTSPRPLAQLCRRRPVEELPRLVTLLSPAHHLAAALALDRLGEVTPPEMAQNMREGLRLALTYRRHLRKLYFLLLAWENPWANGDSLGSRRRSHTFPPRLMDDAWRHLSLAQEAVAILGGRFDHPVTAVAGGVSRFLKEEHYARLAVIAGACRDFALSFSDFLASQVFLWGREEGWLAAELPPLPSLTLSTPEEQFVRRDGRGQEQERFTAPALWEKVGRHQEPWTYEDFAYFREQGWQHLEPTSVDHLFAVGRCPGSTAAPRPAPPPRLARWNASAASWGRCPAGSWRRRIGPSWWTSCRPLNRWSSSIHRRSSPARPSATYRRVGAGRPRRSWSRRPAGSLSRFGSTSGA